jgi:anti-sigma factor RsiW
MMKCEEVRGVLEACSTGELEASASGEVERHLGSCEACRREFVQLRQLAAFLRGTPAPPVPAGFAAAILARAGTGSSIGWWRASSSLMRVAAALVVAAGMLAGGLMGSRAAVRGGSRPPAGDPASAPFPGFVRDVPESSPVGAYLSLVSEASEEVRKP